MSMIQLFDVNGTVKELAARTVALEKDLQTLVENNMETFFGVTMLKSEYVIANGRMDSIGIDENGCPVIFEYKRSLNENVINQGLFYLDWLLDHKADFKLLVMEKHGSEMANQIDWSMPCVICIANDFTKYDVHAVNQMQRNIRLVKYKWYDGLLLFEHLNTPAVSAQSGNTASQPVSNDASVLKPKKQTKTFVDYYEQAGEKSQQLFQSLRQYLLDTYEDATENRLKLYVAFKRVKNFVCAEVYQSGVVLHLNLDPKTVELQDDFIKDVSKKGHWGTGNLEIILRNEEQLEIIKPLLERSYNEN